MAKARAGYEWLVYQGTAGSTAGTQMLHVKDFTLNKSKERWETTDRGDGSAVPKKTEQVVTIAASATLVVIYHDGDASTAALIAVDESGGDIAIKAVNHTGGDTHFDGDCSVDGDYPGGLKDGQEITFTLFPSQDSGRTWSF